MASTTTTTTTNTDVPVAEYVEYESIRGNLDRIYGIFIDKNESKSRKYIPFLKKSFETYTDGSTTDKSIITSTTTTLLSVNNFAELQSQALKGKLNHTKRSGVNDETPYNSNNASTGFLNFTKRDSDSDSAVISTVADTYIVVKSEKRASLIYTTIEIIEIFINILEAYKKFTIKSLQKNISMNTVTDIFIVSSKVRKAGYRTSDTMAVYVENRIGKSPLSGYNFPSSNTLFLIIKSFDNDIMNDTTPIATDNYNIYYKKNFKFNNNGIPVISTSSSTSKEDDLFSEDELSLNAEAIFSGILLSKSEDGSTIRYNTNDVPPDDLTKLDDTADTNKTMMHGTNKKLCAVILKNFLCYLHDIEPVDINIQINALLYYYKIMKCYLLNSVYMGNYLFNTQYKNGKEIITGNSALSTTIVAIDPIITNATKIGNQFQPTSSKISAWEYLIETNTTINNTLNNLTIEIENSITGNNVQNNSIIYPSIFKGFYVKKISETIIELSPVLSPLRKKRTDNPFDTYYLKNYDTSPTVNKVFFDNKGNIINSLTTEEEYLANILKNNSISNKEIIKQYQIEINTNLYTINEIFTKTDPKSKKVTITRIEIFAKFEYLNVSSSTTNTSKLFKFERNTYDVFSNKTNLTRDNIDVLKEDVMTVFNVNGKVTSTSNITGKYILLYNYDDHPTVNNHVILSKTVNLKKTYNEDMDKLKDINNRIVFNETKINNSGRLYDIQDKEYSILYNQLIVYYVVIAILFCIIIIINYADVESDLVAKVTTVCFITIVILIISYYLVDIVYIEKYVNVENFNIEHFNIPNTFIYSNGLSESNAISSKVGDIQTIMNGLSSKIDIIIKLLMVAIPQVEFIETNNILNSIVENEKNEKIYVNELLDHRRINSYNFIDVKKYDITALNTLIKTVLATALVIFGLYTTHFYVNNKYNDTLIFMCAIFLIIIFAYYVIYSNRVVRTISKNVYWGKEFQKSYEK